MFFNLILLLFKILFPFIKQKKTLIHVSWVSMVIVILVSNYEFIRYDKVNILMTDLLVINGKISDNYIRSKSYSLFVINLS